MSREYEHATISLSLVIPVYSGENYLLDLIAEIESLRNRWLDLSINIQIAEAIFVLDEPIDESKESLSEQSSKHAWVRTVELSRNFGQHSATVAGTLYSSGDWVITLDEDLQHPPICVESLLTQACTERADIVYALPKRAVHGGFYRDFSSRVAKSIVSKLSGNDAVLYFNSFRLIRGDIARAAASICAQNTYFDVALTWFTTSISNIILDLRDSRNIEKKQSGYRLSSLLKHAKRLLVTTNVRVLWLATSLALISFLFSAGYGAWIVYLKLFSESTIDAPGWASLMVVLLAFGGAGVFMLGVITDLVHISMLQILGKPAFFVVNRSTDKLLEQEVKKFRAG